MHTPTIPVTLDQRLAVELPTGDLILIDTMDSENIKVERLDSTGEFVSGWQFDLALEDSKKENNERGCRASLI